MTITLPPREVETPPAAEPRTIQVWFQPQSIGKCRGCGATISWRTTAKNNRPIPMDLEPRRRDHDPPDPRGPFLIRRFARAGAEARRDGDRVDVVNAAYAHWVSCPVQQRFRRRQAAVQKPIQLKPAPPAPPAAPSLFEED